jgi:hypothetical protein
MSYGRNSGGLWPKRTVEVVHWENTVLHARSKERSPSERPPTSSRPRSETKPLPQTQREHPRPKPQELQGSLLLRKCHNKVHSPTRRLHRNPRQLQQRAFQTCKLALSSTSKQGGLTQPKCCLPIRRRTVSWNAQVPAVSMVCIHVFTYRRRGARYRGLGCNRRHPQSPPIASTVTPLNFIRPRIGPTTRIVNFSEREKYMNDVLKELGAFLY